jgi:hypothetical protein
MGLFRWFVKLGEYGEFVADGYAYAENNNKLLEELKWKYNNEYHNVTIEDDWEFDNDDIESLKMLEFVQYVETKIAVRWED